LLRLLPKALACEINGRKRDIKNRHIEVALL
jgi:hypothetical protein